MLRCSVILATVVALLLGSLGLPISLYSCEMMKVRQALTPPCGGCCSRTPIVRQCVDHDRRGGVDRPPCCSIQRKLLRAETTALPSPADPLPRLLPAWLAPAAPWSDRFAVDARSKLLMDHPPPLASHVQGVYLFNSTFLI